MKLARTVGIGLFLLPAVILRADTATRPAGKPNVIFILTDDQGWNDAAFAGHPYVKTPHLDRFASESTWVRQFYVGGTVCSPSRCAFMTSHSPARHLIHGHFADHDLNAARQMPDWLDPGVPTLPGLLQNAGYATAHFGKWHLGSGTGAPPPEDYGFDTSKTANSSGPSLGSERDEPYFRARSTAMIVDETIQFIREHRDGPFYVNLWTLLPHALLKPTPEQLAEYADLAPSPSKPGFGPWMRDYLGNAKDLKSQMQVFCASLTDLDTQLGRLFATLDELELSDNTIIFFSSDNGAEDYRIGNASNAGVGNTGPLRARKRSMYEGGIRTFGLVRWPGHVPAGRRDETSVMGGVDFLPTICSLAGVTLPDQLHLDGEDVSDIWLGATRPRKRPLHWEWLFSVQGAEDGYMPPTLAVRDGDWKLFVNHNSTGAQLYNIPADISEQHDVAAQHPDIVKSLTAKALAWSESLPASPARESVKQTGLPYPGRATPAAETRKGKAGQKAGQKKENPSNDRSATPDRSAIFDRWDKDADGRLTLDEYTAGLARKDNTEQRFRNFDTDGNGLLSKQEFTGKSPTTD